MSTRGQQRRTAQAHGIGHADAIDTYHQVSDDVAYRWRQPGRADNPDRVDGFPSFRHVVIEVGRQR